MKTLDTITARKIYQKNYINDPGFNKIKDIKVLLAVVDYGINRGPVVAVKDLQKVLGLKEDGILGSYTLSCIEKMSIDDIMSYLILREKRIKKESKKVFKKGLLNRVNIIRKKIRELNYG